MSVNASENFSVLKFILISSLSEPATVTRNGKRLLLISYIYAPKNGPGIGRVVHFVDFLSEQGYKVTVLCRAWEGDRPLHQSDDATVIAIGTPVSSSGRFNKKKTGVKHSAKNLLKRFVHFKLLRLLPAYYKQTDEGHWAHQAKQYIRNNFRQGDFDLILSSFPDSSVLEVGKAAKQQIGGFWIIDYRDLWAGSIYSTQGIPSSLKKLIQIKEKTLIASANAFTFAARGLKKIHETLFDLNCPKAIVYNGFINDGQTRKPNRKPDGTGTIKIGYTGKLYEGKRDPRFLFELAKRFPSVELHLAVRDQTDFDILTELKKQYGSGLNVELYLDLPYHQAIELQSRMDVLALVYETDGSDWMYPTAKLFEYMKLQRVILLNAAPNSEVYDILDEIEAEYYTPETFHPDKVTGSGAPYNQEKLLNYTRDEQAKNLLNILQSANG